MQFVLHEILGCCVQAQQVISEPDGGNTLDSWHDKGAPGSHLLQESAALEQSQSFSTNLTARLDALLLLLLRCL